MSYMHNYHSHREVTQQPFSTITQILVEYPIVNMTQSDLVQGAVYAYVLSWSQLANDDQTDKSVINLNIYNTWFVHPTRTKRQSVLYTADGTVHQLHTLMFKCNTCMYILCSAGIQHITTYINRLHIQQFPRLTSSSLKSLKAAGEETWCVWACACEWSMCLKSNCICTLRMCLL